MTEIKKSLILIQCKNWSAKVGTATTREFIGALEKYKVEHSDKRIVGIMIAANGYTEGALNEVKAINTKVILTTTEKFKKVKTKQQLSKFIGIKEIQSKETIQNTSNYLIIEKGDTLTITRKK